MFAFSVKSRQIFVISNELIREIYLKAIKLEAIEPIVIIDQWLPCVYILACDKQMCYFGNLIRTSLEISWGINSINIINLLRNL